jgi:inorganic pyrophosphatase
MGRRVSLAPMPNLVTLSPKLDARGQTCRAIVECPKGGRAKYAYDPRTGAFEMKRLLPDGMSFPLDFGFVPGTRAQDGDPLDILILNDEPACVGALVGCRLIGILEGEQAEEGERFRNDRVLAVACVSHLFKDVRKPADLDREVIDNLSQFWVNYDALRGATFKVLGFKGPTAAVAALKSARRKRRR